MGRYKLQQKAKQSLVQKLVQKLTLKNVLIVGTVSSLLLGIGIAAFLYFGNQKSAEAATSGDYRSKASGNWNSTSTWEKFNGTIWVAAVATPTSTDGVITIQSGNTVTVTAGITIDQVVVSSGAVLTLSSGTVNINDGTGTDLQLDGTLNDNSQCTVKPNSSVAINGLYILNTGGGTTINAGGMITINNGGRYRKNGGSQTTEAGRWTVNSGGTYQHNDNGTNVPNAVWNTGSTLEITGTINTHPANLDQTFYNVIWNCPNQNDLENLTGNPTGINGDFTIISTGTGSTQFAQGSNVTLPIGGNLNMQGGTFYLTETGANIITITGNYVQTGGSFNLINGVSSAGGALPTMNVTGNFTISGGTFNMSQYTASNVNNGIGTLNLSGNFSYTGGTITETATNTGNGVIVFKKAGTQVVTGGGTISNSINFIVNSGSTINIGTTALASSGNFTLSSGAGIILGSPDGISSASTAVGNIRTLGTRSFNTSANYTYAGTAPQVTGDGLPATVNSLTFNNSAGVTLTNSVNPTSSIAFTSGIVTVGSKTLTLGSSTAAIGTLTRTSGYVLGNFTRWVGTTVAANILFPIGTTDTYNGLNLSYTSHPTTGGKVVASFVSTDPGMNGLPISDNGTTIGHMGTKGYWQLSSMGGVTGGVYVLNLNANGFFGVLDFSSLRVIYRADASANWTVKGDHTIGTGSNTSPVANRSNINATLGQYGIGGGQGNPLPITLVYFDAKPNGKSVDLSWETKAEVNNDYFTIERSVDGSDFTPIITQNGAGNSTEELFYTATDDEAITGVSYYRLKQTDYDGKFSYSDIQTVTMAEPSSASSLVIASVGPNPFVDHFAVEYTMDQSTDVNVQIMNMSGQIVYQESVSANEGSNRYDFRDNDNMPKGIYFINMIADDKVVTQKMMKTE